MGALTDAEPVLWWEDAAASLQAFRAFNVLWELVERLEGEGSPDPAFFDAVVRCCDFMAAHAREGEALAVALWRVQWLLLERAGWATPFPAETCPQDRRRWVWSPEGGLLGADQLAAHDLSLPLTPAMLDVLMAIAARRRPALTPELIAGLDAFFERLWAYHLGSPLRSLLHAPVDAKGEGFRPVRVAESVREG